MVRARLDALRLQESQVAARIGIEALFAGLAGVAAIAAIADQQHAVTLGQIRPHAHHPIAAMAGIAVKIDDGAAIGANRWRPPGLERKPIRRG